MAISSKGRLNLPDFDLRCHCEAPIEPFGDPSEFLTEITCQIVQEVREDGSELPTAEHVAGLFQVAIFQLERARHEQQPAMHIFDCHSQLFLEAYEHFFTPDTDMMSEKIVNLLSLAHPRPIQFLWIDRVEILPRFRGQGLGLAAVLKALEMFGNNHGVAGLLAAPLRHGLDISDTRWRSRMKMKQFPPDSEAVRQRLGSYWERLGFVAAGDGYFARDLADPLPPLEAVLEELEDDRSEGDKHE